MSRDGSERFRKLILAGCQCRTWGIRTRETGQPITAFGICQG